MSCWKDLVLVTPGNCNNPQNLGVYQGTKIRNTTHILDCKTVRIFAYSSTQRASSQTKGLERSWKQRARPESESETWGESYGRVRLARFARVRLLRQALPISLLILSKKKPTVLQSTHIHIKRVVSSSCLFYLMLSTSKVAKLSSSLLLICKIRKGTKKK